MLPAAASGRGGRRLNPLAAGVDEVLAGYRLVDPVVLLGGMDSHAVLYAALRAGHRPTVAVVRLAYGTSYEAHLAATTAEREGLALVEIGVERGEQPLGSRHGWPFSLAIARLGGRDYLTGHGITDQRGAVSVEREREIVAYHHAEAVAVGGRFLAPLLDPTVAPLIPRPDRRGKPTLVDAYPELVARFRGPPPAHRALIIDGGLGEVRPVEIRPQ